MTRQELRIIILTIILVVSLYCLGLTIYSGIVSSMSIFHGACSSTVERWDVTPVVAGSNPVKHPMDR